MSSSGSSSEDENGWDISEPIDYICALSQNLMQDPVFLEDEPKFNYERQFIQDWIKTCQDQGKPLSSPMTRRNIRPNIKGNAVLKQKIHGAWQKSLIRDGETSILKLRSLFSHLDSLRDILSETLRDWQPPQIVVLGGENTGKSSVLERLAMMPFLPRDSKICTRVPIHIRMRNTQDAHPPKLMVMDTKTKQIVEGPHIIPIQWGDIEVKSKMDEILNSNPFQKCGFSDNRTIIVEVQGPLLPSVDLVDLPGLVAVPPQDHARTKNIILNHIRRHDAYSIYLVTVQASTGVRNSVAMSLVQDQRLQSKCLGVFTKCDVMDAATAQQVCRTLSASPSASGVDDDGCVSLQPHGWVATSNCPDDSAPVRALERLRKQAKAEEQLFQKRYPDLHRTRRSGCRALVRQLSEVVDKYTRESWAPATLDRLRQARDEAQRQEADLGLPALDGSDPARARGLAAEEAAARLRQRFPSRVDECCRTVLDNFRRDLLSAPPPTPGPPPPSEGGGRESDQWAIERRVMAERLERGVGAWVVFWRAELRAALQDDEPPRGTRKRGSGGGGGGGGEPSFRLAQRFPAFVEAAVRRGDALLEARAREARWSGLELLSSFYRGGRQLSVPVQGPARQMLAQEAVGLEEAEPWVRVRLRLDEQPPRVDLALDREALVSHVVLELLRRSDLGGQLAAQLRTVAEGVLEWREACADSRAALQTRLARLRRAEMAVVAMLRDRAPTPAAGAAGQSQPPREGGGGSRGGGGVMGTILDWVLSKVGQPSAGAAVASASPARPSQAANGAAPRRQGSA